MAYYQRVWAQIDENGIVQNRIVCDDYETANEVSRCTYGEKALAVQINNWDTNVGDKYIDGEFYAPDGETKRDYIPDLEDEVKVAKNTANANIEDITAVQLAMAEMYETMIGG